MALISGGFLVIFMIIIGAVIYFISNNKNGDDK